MKISPAASGRAHRPFLFALGMAFLAQIGGCSLPSRSEQARPESVSQAWEPPAHWHSRENYLRAYRDPRTPEHARERLFFESRYWIGRHPGPDDPFRAWDDEWCSEFVSFLFWQAGAGLGREPTLLNSSSWRFSDSEAIIGWFRSRGWYFETPELAGRTPLLGDYVHIRSGDGSWKHSGIVMEVRRQSDGIESLFALEGNHRGEPVGTFAYQDWRHKKSGEAVVWGIGFRQDLPPPHFNDIDNSMARHGSRPR